MKKDKAGHSPNELAVAVTPENNPASARWAHDAKEIKLKELRGQFDLFDEDTGHREVARRTRKKTTSPLTSTQAHWDAKTAVRLLEGSGDFRVLRRLTPRPAISRHVSAHARLGVLVDTETTGLNHQTDEVIEIGLVAFTYDDDGAIGDVVGVYSGLRQPSMPIPAEITRLTGSQTTWCKDNRSICPP